MKARPWHEATMTSTIAAIQVDWAAPISLHEHVAAQIRRAEDATVAEDREYAWSWPISRPAREAGATRIIDAGPCLQLGAVSRCDPAADVGLPAGQAPAD
jgi:hypothetical protein